MKNSVLLAVVLSLFFIGPANAADGPFYGCLECDRSTALGLFLETCEQVGDNETGQIQCEHLYFGGRLCRAYGGACLNTNVCSSGNCGGPGWGGGGGDDECSVGPGEYCPVSCPSCTIYYATESPDPEAQGGS